MLARFKSRPRGHLWAIPGFQALGFGLELGFGFIEVTRIFGTHPRVSGLAFLLGVVGCGLGFVGLGVGVSFRSSGL